LLITITIITESRFLNYSVLSKFILLYTRELHYKREIHYFNPWFIYIRYFDHIKSFLKEVIDNSLPIVIRLVKAINISSDCSNLNSDTITPYGLKKYNVN